MAETESAEKKIWIGIVIFVIGTALTWYFLPWLWADVFVPSAKAVCRFDAAVGHHLASSATVPWWLLWILIVVSGEWKNHLHQQMTSPRNGKADDA